MDIFVSYYYYVFLFIFFLRAARRFGENGIHCLSVSDIGG